MMIAEKAKVECRDSVNRWTDNIFILKSWMKKKFTGMDKQIDGFFVQVGICFLLFTHVPSLMIMQIDMRVT
jgi:hypothetical protein